MPEAPAEDLPDELTELLVAELGDDFEIGELSFVPDCASAEAVVNLFMPHLRNSGALPQVCDDDVLPVAICLRGSEGQRNSTLVSNCRTFRTIFHSTS